MLCSQFLCSPTVSRREPFAAVAQSWGDTNRYN